MAVTNPKSAEGALKLARVCESVYSGLTRILQNRSLLLGRTTIEYESEFSRWTCCFPRCPYWARARSAIPRTVLQKTEREGEREFWRTGDRVCRRPYTHSGRLNSSVRSIRSFHAELKLDRPNRCLERSTVIFVRGVIDRSTLHRDTFSRAKTGIPVLPGRFRMVGIPKGHNRFWHADCNRGLLASWGCLRDISS